MTNILDLPTEILIKICGHVRSADRDPLSGCLPLPYPATATSSFRALETTCRSIHNLEKTSKNRYIFSDVQDLVETLEGEVERSYACAACQTPLVSKPAWFEDQLQASSLIFTGRPVWRGFRNVITARSYWKHNSRAIKYLTEGPPCDRQLLGSVENILFLPDDEHLSAATAQNMKGRRRFETPFHPASILRPLTDLVKKCGDEGSMSTLPSLVVYTRRRWADREEISHGVRYPLICKVSISTLESRVAADYVIRYNQRGHGYRSDHPEDRDHFPGQSPLSVTIRDSPVTLTDDVALLLDRMSKLRAGVCEWSEGLGLASPAPCDITIAPHRYVDQSLPDGGGPSNLERLPDEVNRALVDDIGHYLTAQPGCLRSETGFIITVGPHRLTIGHSYARHERISYDADLFDRELESVQTQNFNRTMISEQRSSYFEACLEHGPPPPPSLTVQPGVYLHDTSHLNSGDQMEM